MNNDESTAWHLIPAITDYDDDEEDRSSGTASGSVFEFEVLGYLRSAFPELECEHQFHCGESLLGTHRRIDIACFSEDRFVLAIECKYQRREGTTDDKIRHAADELLALKASSYDPLGIMLIYSGDGWKDKGRLFGPIPFAFEFLRTDRKIMNKLFDEICIRSGLQTKLRKNRNQLLLSGID